MGRGDRDTVRSRRFMVSSISSLYRSQNMQHLLACNPSPCVHIMISLSISHLSSLSTLPQSKASGKRRDGAEYWNKSESNIFHCHPIFSFFGHNLPTFREKRHCHDHAFNGNCRARLVTARRSFSKAEVDGVPSASKDR